MFERDNITRLALIAFEKNTCFNISGLGQLKKVYLNAYFEKGGHELHPPGEQVYLYNNTHTKCDPYLVELIRSLRFCDEEQAVAIVKKWEASWLNREDNNPFYFGKYGYFQRNGQVDFYNTRKTFYNYLPNVTCRYEGRYNVLLPEVAFRKGTQLREIVKKRRKPVLVPVLWTLLLISFGASLFFWKEPIQRLFNDRAALEKKLVNVAPRSYTDTKSTTYFSDTNESLLADNTGKKDSMGEKSTAVFSPKEAEVNTETRSEQCTLIVGAFANNGNVERMRDRLGEMNLVPVLLQGKTLTLVGAKLDCSHSDDEINRIRSEIEPNAWMYKK